MEGRLGHAFVASCPRVSGAALVSSHPLNNAPKSHKSTVKLHYANVS